MRLQATGRNICLVQDFALRKIKTRWISIVRVCFSLEIDIKHLKEAVYSKMRLERRFILNPNKCIQNPKPVNNYNLVYKTLLLYSAFYLIFFEQMTWYMGVKSAQHASQYSRDHSPKKEFQSINKLRCINAAYVSAHAVPLSII